MKKTLLKCLAVMSFALFTTTAFADASVSSAATSTTSIISEEEALQSKAVSLKAAANGVGTDTDIIVINFTDTTVNATAPDRGVMKEYVLTRHTAIRVRNPGYTGTTWIQLLTNPTRQQFWAANVAYQNTVGIHLSNGQYVVLNSL